MTIKLYARDLFVEELKIDEAYQRMIVKKQVKWIVGHYDEVAFGRLLVGERSLEAGAGKWVVDGQQRLTAARRLGMNKVPCLVFESEGRQHEAEVFRTVNTQRTKVKPFHVYRAALEARDPAALAICAILESENYYMTSGGGRGMNWAGITGVNCCFDIYRMGGADLLRNTLRLIREAWEGDREATGIIVLGGIAVFLQTYGDIYERHRLVKKMKTKSPLDVLRLANDLGTLIGGSDGARKKFSTCLACLYNKSIKNKKNRLPVSLGSEEEKEAEDVVE